MKKIFLIAVCVVCALVICSSILFSSNGQKDCAIKVTNVVSDSVNSKGSDLLSMLNHNFVYGADFDNADNMVNCSMNALLNLKDGNDYIKEGVVADFVSNMYGVDVVDLSKLNADYPHKDGYVFVVPRGYTKYEHSNIRLNKNEDGTITAITDVLVLDHDGNGKSLKATSLFVPNANSAFGYNIVYSEILGEGNSL